VGVFSSLLSNFTFLNLNLLSDSYRINQPPPFPVAPTCQDAGTLAEPALPPADLAWAVLAPISLIDPQLSRYLFKAQGAIVERGIGKVATIQV